MQENCLSSLFSDGEVSKLLYGRQKPEGSVFYVLLTVGCFITRAKFTLPAFDVICSISLKKCPFPDSQLIWKIYFLSISGGCATTSRASSAPCPRAPAWSSTTQSRSRPWLPSPRLTTRLWTSSGKWWVSTSTEEEEVFVWVCSSPFFVSLTFSQGRAKKSRAPPPFPGVADIYLGHFLPCSGSLFLPFSSQFFTPFFCSSSLVFTFTGNGNAESSCPLPLQGQASLAFLSPYSRRYLLQAGRGFNGKVVKTAALLREKLVQ